MNYLKTFLAISLSVVVLPVKGGGIITNTNQSTAWVRSQTRGASQEIDAVYFNPAGLTGLNQGLNLSVNSQTILSKKTVESNYATLNNKYYKGDITVPVFPTIYAAYNTGKWAFSAGFNPIGGGGEAIFNNGLPSFEMGVSNLKTLLNAYGVTDYSSNIYFKGSSVDYGFQLGASYKVNQTFSLFIGGRYVYAINQYKGYLKDNALIFSNNTKLPASTFFTNAGDPISATLLGDQEADVKQTGSGFAPILGANVTLLDNKLNIGLKYEFLTKITVKNDTKKDLKVAYNSSTSTYITQFPDKAETAADIPALLAIGASYKVSEKLSASAGLHYYFDKNADFGWTHNGTHASNKDIIKDNNFELMAGLEYKLSAKFLASAGYTLSKVGVNPEYNSDFAFGLTSNTVGVGGKLNLSPKVALNLGASYTYYNPSDKNYTSTINVPAKETYGRDVWIIGIGLDFNLGK